MSCTEFHKGKFKIIAKGDEAIIDFAKKNNLVEKFDLDIEDGKIKFHDCYEHANCKYEIFDITYNDHNVHVLVEFTEHTEVDDGSHDIDEFNQVGPDEFEFTAQFYNGGCCLSEIIESHLEHVDLDAAYEKTAEMVEISPRESYMILDCFQYVLSCMDKEKLDYLFCNYSKDEISKFARQFCNLNAKNNW